MTKLRRRKHAVSVYIWALEAYKGRAVPKFCYSCTSCTKIWHSCTSCSSCTCCSRCVCCNRLHVCVYDWIYIIIYYSSSYFTTAVLNLVQLHFLSYSCGTAHLSYSSCSRNYRILLQLKPWDLLGETPFFNFTLFRILLIKFSSSTRPGLFFV